MSELIDSTFKQDAIISILRHRIDVQNNLIGRLTTQIEETVQNVSETSHKYNLAQSMIISERVITDRAIRVLNKILEKPFHGSWLAQRDFIVDEVLKIEKMREKNSL